MSLARDLLRATVVSGEALVVTLVWACGYWFPSTLGWLLTELAPEDFAGKTVLLGLPFALLVGCFGLGYSLLNPDDSRQALKQWPEYWRLRLRIMVALAWATAGIVATLLGWLLYRADHQHAGGILLLCGLLVPCCTIASLALAKIALRDALDSR